MDVLLAHVVAQHRGDGVRLRDLLGLEPLPLQHVQEVGVAAHVQLHRPVELDAAVAEDLRQRAVRDRRADLRLDVVADDRQAAVLEALAEVAALRDEDRHAVHHRAARLQDLLRVPLRRLFRPDGEVVDDDVRARLLEDPHDIVRVARRLLDDLRDVLAEPVVRHPARDLDAGLRHLGELVRVVRVRPDRLGEVLADLVGRDVERGRELDIADVIAAQVDMHQAGNELVRRRVLVELHALEQGVGAVADADDRHAHLVFAARSLAVRCCHWSGAPLSGRARKAFGQDLVDELVGVRASVCGALLEPVLEVGGHAEQDVAFALRRRALSSTGLEGDGEARGQDPDCHVVQVAPTVGNLGRQSRLQLARHPNEHILPASTQVLAG